MAEKYGIQAVIKPSISERPVSIGTELVFIGCAATASKVYEPVKLTSFKDYKDTYGEVTTPTLSLEKSAQYAFDICGVDHAWFINCSSSSTSTDKGFSAANIKAGVDSIDEIYSNHGIVPNLIVLPMNSMHETPSTIAAYAATKCLKINDLFKAQLVIDNSIADSDLTEIVKSSTSTGTYKNKLSIDKDCADGNVIACLGDGVIGRDEYTTQTVPCSVILACTRASQDALNTGDVPSRSAGNLKTKGVIGYQVDVINGQQIEHRPIVNTDTINNTLAAAGYALLVNKGQNIYHIWGDHTAAVHGDGEVDDELYRFDSNVAMAYHIANRAILKWKDDVDSTMNLNLRNLIIMEEQSYLDYLVSIGALIGEPKCEFRSEDNTSDTLGLGQFYFTNVYTNSIPAKYLQFNLVWTAEGLNALLG